MFANRIPEYWQLVHRYLPSRFSALRQPHEPPPTPAFCWSTEEFAILQAHLGRPSYFDPLPADNAALMKTSLLYFAPNSRSLLFDACWPNTAANEALLQQPLSTRLAHQGRILHLQLEGQELFMLDGGPALRLWVGRHELKSAQPHSCVFPSHRAPSAALLLPCEGLWQGRLMALSEDCLTVESLQSRLPQHLGQRGECTLDFGEQLRMTLPITVQNVRLHRSPHRHARLSLRLAGLADGDREQLDSLRRCLAACP